MKSSSAWGTEKWAWMAAPTKETGEEVLSPAVTARADGRATDPLRRTQSRPVQSGMSYYTVSVVTSREQNEPEVRTRIDGTLCLLRYIHYARSRPPTQHVSARRPGLPRHPRSRRPRGPPRWGGRGPGNGRPARPPGELPHAARPGGPGQTPAASPCPAGADPRSLRVSRGQRQIPPAIRRGGGAKVPVSAPGPPAPGEPRAGAVHRAPHRKERPRAEPAVPPGCGERLRRPRRGGLRCLREVLRGAATGAADTQPRLPQSQSPVAAPDGVVRSFGAGARRGGPRRTAARGKYLCAAVGSRHQPGER